MELDYIKIFKLNLAELQHQIENNLYKQCGNPSHYAQNCNRNGNYILNQYPNRSRSS